MPVRDGVPLPGWDLPSLVSLLTYRVFGPLRRRHIRVVLDYHGLAGRVAGPVAQVAARAQVSDASVRLWVARVREAGRRLPVPAELAEQASRPSTTDADHLGRLRIAATLGLPGPKSAVAVAPQRVSARARAAGLTGVRVLAAAGPLDLNTLLAAVTRPATGQGGSVPGRGELVAGLTAAGATVDRDGRWHPPPGAQAPPRYRAIMTAAAPGQVFSRREMIQLLVEAGYSPVIAAHGRTFATHPLIRHVGRNRYRLIGTPPHAD